MKYKIIKTALAAIGAKLPRAAIHLANGTFNYLHIGWWFKEKGFSISSFSVDRPNLYRVVMETVSEPASYLEFGVFKGASARMWSALLKHDSSTLDGFDSFQGLPEVWRMAADLKTFDANGSIPIVDDSRVRFHQGWFETTLPEFLKTFKRPDQLILHVDADLYSSTKFVLEQMNHYILAGTIIIFDELFDREHELKALDEFLDSNPMHLECIGATAGFTQAAFRVIDRITSKDR